MRRDQFHKNMAFSLAFRYDVFAASVCITSADEHPSGKDPEVSGVVEKKRVDFSHSTHIHPR